MASEAVQDPVEEQHDEVEHKEGNGEQGEGPGAASAAGAASEGLGGPLSGDLPSGGQQVVCKMLISNAAAGSVIGKVGRRDSTYLADRIECASPHC